jgi:excisionase family DNA binding protein
MAEGTVINAPQTGEPEFLSLPEAAAVMRIHTRTVRRMINRGELRAYRFGNTWRIGREDLWKYIQQNLFQPGVL